MRQLDRREALVRIGSSAAGLLCLPGTRAPLSKTRSDDLEDLAERLRGTSGSGAFDVATRAIRSGADCATMLGAIFLVGVREIRPRPHGILHSVMIVESSFQLAEPVVTQEAWLPVLWNLDDLKRSQERDRNEDGDWVLPPPPQARRTSAEKARQEFVSAMESWDVERADRAIVELLPHHDHEALFEILWPLLSRCYAFIGHKMIYAAQVERVLKRIGWSYAEPALRSLVRTALVERQTAAFERSRELAPAFPGAWQQGKEDPEQSLPLLKELRTRSSRDAQELVVDAFKSGLGPQTVWDALRLLGADVFQRRRGRTAATGRLALLPVHALTVTNAFGHAWRSAKLQETRRVLILQAAGWLASMQDDLASMATLSMDGPGIEALGVSVAERTSALAPLLERASPGHVRAYLDREPAEAPVYLAHLRRSLFRRGQEHHQHKYAAAMQEESQRVHPRWASRIMAPAVDYLANPADAETEVYRRSLRALREAGIEPSARRLATGRDAIFFMKQKGAEERRS